MRVVLQRVSRAQVRIDGRVRGRIDRGYVLLVAFSAADTIQSLRWMADKILSLRLFPDEGEREESGAPTEAAPVAHVTTDPGAADTSRTKPSSFSRDLADVGGAVLVVSQFTLYGDTRKGRRPSFIDAAAPDRAESLYEQFVELLMERAPGRIATGEFGALMEVELVNDGPVTLILDRAAPPARPSAAHG
jgi:D-tyrosyl-tRNA(Tyr) deacylase